METKAVDLDHLGTLDISKYEKVSWILQSEAGRYMKDEGYEYILDDGRQMTKADLVAMGKPFAHP